MTGTRFLNQIERIKSKFEKAKLHDVDCKVFGSTSHRYEIGEAIAYNDIKEFEEKYGVELPESYTMFLTKFGNGGSSYAGSAAGPFLGIYPFGYGIEEIMPYADKYFSFTPEIHAYMSDEKWETLTAPLDEMLADDAYDQVMATIYGGILPIGSQGCSYIHGLILNGPFTGRVVNIDLGGSKPHLTYEANFLDWYERWLDEILNDTLIKSKSWFAYAMAGGMEKLLSLFNTTVQLERKVAILKGMFKVPKITEKEAHTLMRILDKADQDEVIELVVELIAKHHFHLIELELRGMLKGGRDDQLLVCKLLYHYQLRNAALWVDDLLNIVTSNLKPEAFIYICQLLKQCEARNNSVFEPLCEHPNDKIRQLAKEMIVNQKDM